MVTRIIRALQANRMKMKVFTLCLAESMPTDLRNISDLQHYGASWMQRSQKLVQHDVLLMARVL